jgi:hypothetical protein
MADEFEQMIERSKAVMPQLVSFDARSADALRARSLDALQDLHQTLAGHAADVDQFIDDDAPMAAGDVALLHLKTLVEDAINRIRPSQLYPALDEAARAGEFESYRSYFLLCAEDAGTDDAPALTRELVDAV